MRRLECRLAKLEPAPPGLDRLLDGPQRQLTPAEIERETRRLLAVCAERGVGAVLPEVATCRALLLSVADACFHSGLVAAGQYLLYLAQPYT